MKKIGEVNNMENKCYFFESKMKSYGITPLPKDTEVTMAYVPYQTSNNLEIYSPEQGIYPGTMFPELEKPFLGDNNQKLSKFNRIDNNCMSCGGILND